MILALLGLLGCDPLPDTVTMAGAVADAPYGEGDAVPGAGVAVFDDSFRAEDSVTAADDASFTVDVPAGVAFYLQVSADGYVPTGFSGVAGLQDFSAPAGYPWVASEAWVDDLRATFADCPSVGDAGAIVAGEVRVDTPGAEYTSMPLEPTGSARVYTPDDTEYDACYLDDDGVYAPDATEAGATGRFAIFGVPAGSIIADVRYTQADGTQPVQLFQFDAPEDGLVPIYPALVELLY